MSERARALATLRAWNAELDARLDAGQRRSPPAIGRAPMRLKFEAGDTTAISGYASVFGVLDRQNEIVDSGAFAASLAQHRRDDTRPLMLWQHDPNQPIGIWESVIEDATGLWATGRLLPEISKGAEALALVRGGGIFGLSIGYREKRVRLDASGVRHLVELELLEISIVSFPANQQARLAGGTASDMQARAAIADFVAAVKAADEQRREAEIREAISRVARAAGRARWR